MIAKTLIFVCAAFGLVAGSCFEFRAPQESSPQLISVPVQSAEPTFYATPVENVFSSGSSDAYPSGCSSQIVSAPVVTDNVCNCGSSISFPVVSGPTFSVPVVSESSSPVVVSSGSGNSFSELFSGASSGSSFGAQASNGPETSPLTVLQAPSVTLPAVETPIIALASPAIPAPRVLSQRCICTKTIVRPQIYQRTVTVPKIQRYLKRTITPVVENLSYRSNPVSQEPSSGSSSSQIVYSSGSGSGSGSASGSGSSSPVYVSSGSGYPTSTPVVYSSGSCTQKCY